MADLVNIAPTKIPVGTYGPYASGTAKFTQNGYLLTFTNAADWPASGDVMALTIELSLDGGKTWQFDASVTLAGGQWQTRQRVATNTSTWEVGAPPAGVNRIRATLQMLQEATIGIAVKAL